ncbi:Uncharacterised protein [Chlamydia abortus]|uniref:Cbb3-type cytochrome oxidase assembly protein CcoS n=1 Tax=Paenibacillus residui TaxID=629724 RepID=A0ABW3D755_9BACL|nr:hypothetical protein [Paenibacillus sp. 32O-W]SHE11222.1 Uncharacterised protein [Chlamydia abortus]
MVLFIMIMLVAFVFLGLLCVALVKGLQKDSYDSDVRNLWEANDIQKDKIDYEK